MKINKFKRKSIAFKLAVIFVTAILIQCILMSAILILGGVVSQAQKNAFNEFTGEVDDRKKDLEGHMTNTWTNVNQYTQQIKEEFSIYDSQVSVDLSKPEEILEQISPLLVDALRSTKTTGVFMILNDDVRHDNTHSALYIRDADPNKNSADNSDLSMLVGPWNVAESMGITTDNKWDFRLHLTKENEDFYRKPYEQGHLSENERHVSYWCPPFSLNPGEDEVITYSIPLRDTFGNSIGVFGVEIGINYLYNYLPMTELASPDSYGYMLGISREGSDEITPVITHGALQERMLNKKEKLSLTKNKQSRNVYTLNNHNSQTDIYAAIDKLGMYYNNTPFENEQWYLIGLMEKSALLQFPNKIKSILLISFCISLVLGIVIAVLISNWFTKPIISLAKQMKTGTSEGLQILNGTGLTEIDDLALAISTSHQKIISLSAKMSSIIELTNIPFGAFEISTSSNSVFFTNGLPRLFDLTKEEAVELSNDKTKFLELLGKIYQNQEDGEDVFHLNHGDNDRWIRIIQTKTNEGVLGIAIDITQEMLQAQGLRRERDQDSLTGIRNRTAYSENIAYYNKILSPTVNLGIGVFDLNGLKYVNDSYGHRRGDEYICICSEIICTTFSNCPVFRLGGDEFVAIFKDKEIHLIEKLHEELKYKVRNRKAQSEYDIDIAFGYAFYEQGRDENLEDVFQRADTNMYLNKKELKSK